MKHLKLFEEYVKGEYIQIKPLPDKKDAVINTAALETETYTIGITFKGSDELGALIEGFESRGYEFLSSYDTKENKIRKADAMQNTVLWISHRSKKFYVGEVDSKDITAGMEKGYITRFKDYFKENSDYHGRHTGKNFGV